MATKLSEITYIEDQFLSVEWGYCSILSPAKAMSSNLFNWFALLHSTEKFLGTWC